MNPFWLHACTLHELNVLPRETHNYYRDVTPALPQLLMQRNVIILVYYHKQTHTDPELYTLDINLPQVFEIMLLPNMLAVFDQSIAKPPREPSLPAVVKPDLKSRDEIAEIFCSRRPDSTLYKVANGDFMVFSHGDEAPSHPRSIVIVDDIFCIFSVELNNTHELRRYYGLARQETETIITVEAYKVLRDRAPYPPDQVIKELEGKFAFILFDSKTSILFLARDSDGSVQLHWGTAADGSLVRSDDSEVVTRACGKCYTPFPPGCIFISSNGLTSFDHPLHKVKAIAREDDEGNITGIIFQVDLFTRLHSIPRSGSAANWGGCNSG